MIKISSSLTFFNKKIFPLIWFGFLAFFLIEEITHRIYETKPLALIVPFVMAVFGYFVMKNLIWDLADEVYDYGEFLLIRRSDKEERVALSNIMNVSFSDNRNARRITLRLVQPGSLGAEISFSPVSSFTIIPSAKNPIAEDLIIRVDNARRNRSA